MTEVEIERMEDRNNISVPGEKDVFEESIEILNAARKKLLGY